MTQTRPWWPRIKPLLHRPIETAEIRIELVQRVRRAIAAGTYETPEKWAAALDRLLEELESE